MHNCNCLRIFSAELGHEQGLLDYVKGPMQPGIGKEVVDHPMWCVQLWGHLSTLKVKSIIPERNVRSKPITFCFPQSLNMSVLVVE